MGYNYTHTHTHLYCICIKHTYIWSVYWCRVAIEFSPHQLIAMLSCAVCMQTVWQWHFQAITSYTKNALSAVTNTSKNPLNCKKNFGLISFFFLNLYLLLYHYSFITFCTFKNLFIHILHIYISKVMYLLYVCVCTCVCCVIICMLLRRFNYLHYHCIFITCT